MIVKSCATLAAASLMVAWFWKVPHRLIFRILAPPLMSLLLEAVDHLGAELNWQIQATVADIGELSLVLGFCFTFIPFVPPFKKSLLGASAPTNSMRLSFHDRKTASEVMRQVESFSSKVISVSYIVTFTFSATHNSHVRLLRFSACSQKKLRTTTLREFSSRSHVSSLDRENLRIRNILTFICLFLSPKHLMKKIRRTNSERIHAASMAWDEPRGNSYRLQKHCWDLVTY